MEELIKLAVKLCEECIEDDHEAVCGPHDYRLLLEAHLNKMNKWERWSLLIDEAKAEFKKEKAERLKSLLKETNI